jgi:cytidine diphosphoramidate kinase
MVVWFIGKSASGKTEIGRRVQEELRDRLGNVVYFDGDELRNAISWELGFTVEERAISERRRSRLCKLLADQGFHVVCSGISNEPGVRDWNKRNIENYYEIYLRVPDKILEERDPKEIYGKFSRLEITNVVGMDIPFIEPINPAMVIDNDGSLTPQEIVEIIIERLAADGIIR